MNTTPTWFTEVSSPLGGITLTATTRGLSGLYFQGQRWFPKPEACAQWRRDDQPFAAARAWLHDYFAGRSPTFDEPFDLHGTAFQLQVWEELLTIAPGQTQPYAAIASRIGKASAVRAVGAAIGRNPISLIIPCHRVVGTNGSLTGYAGGLERKHRLLELESQHIQGQIDGL